MDRLKAPSGSSLKQCALITGASGFLGSHLSRYLLAAGVEVHGISRSDHGNRLPELHWWYGDLSNLGWLRDLLAKVKPNLVFHLSGLSFADPRIELVQPTFQSLLASTVNLLIASHEAGCGRIVLVASLAEPESGQSELIPGSPYAAAKWASSVYGRMFHKLYSTPVVMVRSGMAYGPGQNPDKLIPYVTLSLLKGQAPRLSSGRAQSDWIYVEDAIEGYWTASQTPGVEGCTIDLGSGQLASVREVVDQIVAILDSKVQPLFGALPDRPFEGARVADLTDACAKLRWKPKTALPDGLQRTVEWLRKTAL
jgi:UDP-glucose 4-epimerase